MKKWQALSLVMLIFLIGVASGAQGTRLVVRHQIKAAIEKGPAGLHDLLVARLERDLDLDKHQRTQVAAILAQSEREFRGDVQPRLSGLVGRTELRIQRVLAPSQQKVFDRSIRERQQLWSKYDASLALHNQAGQHLSGAVAVGVQRTIEGTGSRGATLGAQGVLAPQAARLGLEGALNSVQGGPVAAKAQASITSNNLAAAAALDGPAGSRLGAQANLTKSAAAADAAVGLPGGRSAAAKVAVDHQGASVSAHIADPVSGAKLSQDVTLSRNTLKEASSPAVVNRPIVMPQARPSSTPRPAFNQSRINSLPPISIPTHR